MKTQVRTCHDESGKSTLALWFGQRRPSPGRQRLLGEFRELARVYEHWERKVKAEGHREGRREGKAEGKAEGKIETQAEAILVVLEGRGLPVSAAQRKRVLACADVKQLDRWLHGAVVASTTEALLAARAAARPRAKRSRPASAATRRG